MSDYMYNNTCSRVKTHFIKGCDLIMKCAEEKGVQSENWVYPQMSFGDPTDIYYAEIWHNGMDWNHHYWIIEKINFDAPKAGLLLHFESHSEREKMNEYIFDELLRAIMWWRRSCLVFSKPDVGHFNDETWTFTETIEGESQYDLIPISMEHASLKKTHFFIDEKSIGKREN